MARSSRRSGAEVATAQDDNFRIEAEGEKLRQQLAAIKASRAERVQRWQESGTNDGDVRDSVLPEVREAERLREQLREVQRNREQQAQRLRESDPGRAYDEVTRSSAGYRREAWDRASGVKASEPAPSTSAAARSPDASRYRYDQGKDGRRYDDVRSSAPAARSPDASRKPWQKYDDAPSSNAASRSPETSRYRHDEGRDGRRGQRAEASRAMQDHGSEQPIAASSNRQRRRRSPSGPSASQSIPASQQMSASPGLSAHRSRPSSWLDQRTEHDRAVAAERAMAAARAMAVPSLTAKTREPMPRTGAAVDDGSSRRLPSREPSPDRRTSQYWAGAEVEDGSSRRIPSREPSPERRAVGEQRTHGKSNSRSAPAGPAVDSGLVLRPRPEPLVVAGKTEQPPARTSSPAARARLMRRPQDVAESPGSAAAMQRPEERAPLPRRNPQFVGTTAKAAQPSPPPAQPLVLRPRGHAREGGEAGEDGLDDGVRTYRRPSRGRVDRDDEQEAPPMPPAASSHDSRVTLRRRGEGRSRDENELADRAAAAAAAATGMAPLPRRRPRSSDDSPGRAMPTNARVVHPWQHQREQADRFCEAGVLDARAPDVADRGAPVLPVAEDNQEVGRGRRRKKPRGRQEFGHEHGGHAPLPDQLDEAAQSPIQTALQTDAYMNPDDLGDYRAGGDAGVTPASSSVAVPNREPPASEGEDDHSAIIRLFVKNQAGDARQYRIKKSTPLRKLMKSYFNVQRLKHFKNLFSVNGQLIAPSDTAGKLGLKDGMQIRVIDPRVSGGQPPAPAALQDQPALPAHAGAVAGARGERPEPSRPDFSREATREYAASRADAASTTRRVTAVSSPHRQDDESSDSSQEPVASHQSRRQAAEQAMHRSPRPSRLQPHQQQAGDDGSASPSEDGSSGEAAGQASRGDASGGGIASDRGGASDRGAVSDSGEEPDLVVLGTTLPPRRSTSRSLSLGRRLRARQYRGRAPARPVPDRRPKRKIVLAKPVDATESSSSSSDSEDLRINVRPSNDPRRPVRVPQREASVTISDSKSSRSRNRNSERPPRGSKRKVDDGNARGDRNRSAKSHKANDWRWSPGGPWPMMPPGMMPDAAMWAAMYSGMPAPWGFPEMSSGLVDYSAAAAYYAQAKGGCPGDFGKGQPFTGDAAKGYPSDGGRGASSHGQRGKKGDRPIPNFSGRPTDEGSRSGTKLFVFSIPGSWSDDDLWECFAACGNVESARVALDPDKKSRGFGFVSYEDHEGAETALKVLNGKEVESGRRLQIEWSRTVDKRAGKAQSDGSQRGRGKGRGRGEASTQGRTYGKAGQRFAAIMDELSGPRSDGQGNEKDDALTDDKANEAEEVGTKENNGEAKQAVDEDKAALEGECKNKGSESSPPRA